MPEPVALVTDLPYWRRGRGDAARIAALHDSLAAHGAVHAVVLTNDTGATPPEIAATLVPAPPGSATATLSAAVGAALDAIRPRAVIVSFARLSGLRRAIPAGTPALLDLHNVYSAVADNWHRVSPPAPVRDRAAEIAAWQAFDRAIAITAGEAAIVATAIGADRTLLCPHPVATDRRAPFRRALVTIGILAANSEANVAGIRWFAAEVLPRLPEPIALAVHGTIDQASLAGLARVRLAGPTPAPSSVLDGFDLFVNPAPWGTGMKIKSAEALAAGLPLVATPAGALGVEGATGSGMIVATDAEGMAAAIRALAADPARRATMADAAHAFARAALTPERCFGPLLDCLALSRAPPSPAPGRP